MDVNEHARLSKYTLRNTLKVEEQHFHNHDDDDLLLAVACGPSTTISALQAAYCEKRRDKIPRVINLYILSRRVYRLLKGVNISI
jgi:hypothetical protein